MVKKIIVTLKIVRQAMPKFYHGERLGFAYKARAIGWRRIFPLSLLPYLTGDEIQLHLSIKPLSEGQEWQQGILRIEPPDLFRDNPELSAIASSTDFEFGEWNIHRRTPPKYRFPVDKWWSRTLSLKRGRSFGQPCNIECNFVLRAFNGDKIKETTPIKIADIEVVSRGPFLTQVFMWLFTPIVGGIIGYFIRVFTTN